VLDRLQNYDHRVVHLDQRERACVWNCVFIYIPSPSLTLPIVSPDFTTIIVTVDTIHLQLETLTRTSQF